MADNTVAGVELTTQPGNRPVQFSRAQIFTIFGALMVGMFLAGLDQTIISTSIRTITDSLHGLSLQAWATTAYLVTATISTPLYGKLSDLYGRRPFYIAAVSIFVVGSLACAFVQSIYQLAASRAVQGLGAGGLYALTWAIGGDVVPPRQQAKYQGMFTAVFITASVAGPLAGGFLAGQAQILHIAGWRWVFLVNAPIGMIGLVVVAAVLRIPHHRREHRLDWLGALTISISVVPLLIIAEQGREWGWGSQRSVICYAVGGVGLVLFLLTERRAGDDALLPLRLFRNSVFRTTSLGIFLVSTTMFGGIALIPLYLQIVKGASPTKAGLLTIPLELGTVFATFLASQITARTGRYKISPLMGMLLLVAGTLLFSRLDVDASLWQANIAMVVFGLGMGSCLQPLSLAAQNALPARDLGVASATTIFFRQMGATLGAAVWLSVMFSTVPDKITSVLRDAAHTTGFQAAMHDPRLLANPADQNVLRTLGSGGGAAGNANGVLNDSSFLRHLDPRLAHPFLVGFEQSMNLTFLVGAVVAVLAFLVVLFLKEIPLRERSGLAERAAEHVREHGHPALGEPTSPLNKGTQGSGHGTGDNDT